jgi:UDP-GlcNAc:undecaprenyl-phosphate/decaprenyl-phosphate GlcNAc-1-phosphate transferase
MAPEDSLAGARVVLSVALLGAVLGFLPHNFNPASIFLGDCGSLLLGYMCVVIILMFGEAGQTHLVFAGLIVFSLPIIDTMLAIIRRWLAGVPMSSGDDQHLHHQLKRATGGVKRAVLGMYGLSALFAAVGVTLAALVMYTELRVRVVYVIALVLFGCIGVLAVKAARRQQLRVATARQQAPVPPKDAEKPAEDRAAPAVK